MTTQKSRFILRDIKIPLRKNSGIDYDFEAISAAERFVKKSSFFAPLGKAEFAVCKRSVDARKKDSVFFIYSVIFGFCDEQPLFLPEELEAICRKEGVTLVHSSSFDISAATSKQRPVIVGFGPCGMFLALVLSRAGLCPIVLERGADADRREKTVEGYWRGDALDCETNVQFGEGGAGTFSDGKLLTRINDSLCTFVLDTFHDHGADESILTNAKPHIGTDKLREIVKSIRREIISLGGEVRFLTRLDGVTFDSAGKTAFLCINGEKNSLSTDALFLCPGHSARDTFRTLSLSGVELFPKPFSVGVRIEHLQRNIDKALYGDNAENPALPKGEYALSLREGDRAVYTFCMCPGGTVVASASENGTIVTNGMSYFSRDGENANSAVAVSVSEGDFGNNPFSAIEYQHRIERAAYDLAGGNSSAPVMYVSDFLGKKAASGGFKVTPTYTGKTSHCDIRKIFPDYVNIMLEKGLLAFDRKLHGFADGGAVLTAPETRTSSPVRIPRTEQRNSSAYPCLYPCGEGAGYAGGITSAAVDGVKTALQYIEKLNSEKGRLI